MIVGTYLSLVGKGDSKSELIIFVFKQDQESVEIIMNDGELLKMEDAELVTTYSYIKSNGESIAHW